VTAPQVSLVEKLRRVSVRKNDLHGLAASRIEQLQTINEHLESVNEQLETDIRRLTWLMFYGRQKFGSLWTEMTDEEIDAAMKGEDD